MTHKEAEEILFDYWCRNEFKEPLTDDYRWLAFRALWRWYSHAYTFEFLWSAATGEEMDNFGGHAEASDEFKADARRYLLEHDMLPERYR